MLTILPILFMFTIDLFNFPIFQNQEDIDALGETALKKIFSREVFSLLLKEKLTNIEWVRKILSWRHTGFHVHSQVRGETNKHIERIGKYMIKPFLSLERLSMDEKERPIIYRYGEGHLQEERMDYLEFIARVISHIPEKHQVMIRYFGVYANAHRGKMRKRSAESHELNVIDKMSGEDNWHYCSIMPWKDQKMTSSEKSNFLSMEEEFIDYDLPGNFTLYYRVMAQGVNGSCEGQLSACVSVTPAAGKLTGEVT